MDVKFFRPFVDSILYTLSMQCMIEAKTEKPFYKSSGPKVPAAISAQVTIKSKTYEGVVEINFSKESFIEMYDKMLGEKIADVVPEHADTAKEVVNIMTKQGAIEIRNKGYQISNMPFTVSISDSKASASSIIVIPIRTGNGLITLEIPV